MPIFSRLNTEIRLTMLCFSGFGLYSHWVPLLLVPSARIFLAECLGVYSTNIYAGRLHVEIQRLTLL